MRTKIFTIAAILAIAACGDDKPSTANNTVGTNNGTTGSNNNTTGQSNNGTTGTNNSTIVPMPAPFGLDERPANPSCIAPARPTATTGITIDRVFPNLSFSAPVWAQQAPGDDSRWFVIEQGGQIRVFDNDNDVTSFDTFVDLTDRVTSGGERGLLGMAFHPDWPATPKVFISYTGTDGGLKSFVSEFQANADLQTVDRSTERKLLQIDQPYTNHNGGQIGFGPDGFLYAGFGDGGSGGDPQGNGQNVDTLLGAFLRIDVNSGDPYGIPADNPFASGGGKPEIYAWGIRNPWRFSFDRGTGTLWTGDVGQGNWEEVNIIKRGGNYGWRPREGFHCYDQATCNDDAGWIDPETEYSHDNNNKSITGGYVYRGTEIPELVGTYLFADYVSGRIWALEYDQDNKGSNRLLLETGRNVASFAEANNGELLVVDYGGGLFKVNGADPTGVDTFPKTLSATGCMDATNVTKPSAALIPYEPVAPFWSDGAEKLRWFALPDGEKITVLEDGDFDFPVGTVTVKSFKIGGKLVETRLFVRHEDGEWGGYSYEWRDDQTDADLLPAGKVKDVGAQKWIYPSRGDCMTCHTAAAGRTLGPELLQLNSDMTYKETNRISNQMATLEHLGMLDGAPSDLTAAPSLVDPFGTAPLDERADAYMHTNCAGCHRSDAALRVKFDFRSGLSMAERAICNENAVGGRLGIEDARLLVPGQPDLSLMTIRTALRDANGMPLLGSDIVDAQGVQLLRDWVTSVESCD